MRIIELARYEAQYSVGSWAYSTRGRVYVLAYPFLMGLPIDLSQYRYQILAPTHVAEHVMRGSRAIDRDTYMHTGS